MRCKVLQLVSSSGGVGSESPTHTDTEAGRNHADNSSASYRSLSMWAAVNPLSLPGQVRDAAPLLLLLAQQASWLRLTYWPSGHQPAPSPSQLWYYQTTYSLANVIQRQPLHTTTPTHSFPAHLSQCSDWSLIFFGTDQNRKSLPRNLLINQIKITVPNLLKSKSQQIIW